MIPRAIKMEGKMNIDGYLIFFLIVSGFAISVIITEIYLRWRKK